MSEQTLKKLFMGVVALLVLYAVVRVASPLLRPSGGGGGPLASALAPFAKDTITGALITGPGGDRTELKRQGDVWTANGFGSDSASVNLLVRSALDARVVEQAARSSANHAAFGFSPDLTWDVVLRAKRDSVHLLVGTNGSQPASGYFRLANDDRVFLVTGDLRDALAKSFNRWRDRTMVALDTSAVHTLVIERDRERYQIERGANGWHGAQASDTVVKAKVFEVLDNLARLMATSVRSDSTNPPNPETRRIVALGNKGDTLTVVIMVGSAIGWTGLVRGRTERFEIAKYFVEHLTPKRDEVFPRKAK